MFRSLFLTVLLVILPWLSVTSFAQATATADLTDGLSAYATFAANGFGVEGPDNSSANCASGSGNEAGNHLDFGEHVLEVNDSDLGQDVFAFVSHIDEDSDRCVTYDRVRVEIKGGPLGQSVPELEHTAGTESHYRWQFRLPADFQGSSSFCHLFQNKAQGGSETGFPVLTLTARSTVLELIHAPQDAGNSAVDLSIVPLGPFLGKWVEVYVRQLHANNGELEVLIRDVNSGTVLMNYSNGNIDLFRTGASINRPKWGVYRKIVAGLKDETVHFANFCSSESGDICPSLVTGNPEPPEFSFSTPLTVAVSRKKRVLSWGVSNQNGSDFFTVERSDDNGQSYTNLAVIDADGTLASEKLYSYTDNSSAAATMIYRIRLTDLDGTEYLSNAVTVQSSSGGGGGGGGGGNGGGNGGGKPKSLQPYPNPAGATLMVANFTNQAVEYEIMSLLAQRHRSGTLAPGRQTLDVRALPAGTYLLRMLSRDGTTTVRRFVKR